MSNLISDYKKMGKAREVEEVWDLYLIRPAGFLFVQLFRRTSITPNQISAFSVLVAWICAWLLYRTSLAGNDLILSLQAALVMFLYSALDSADGQLARVTGKGSFTGRTVDGFCDNLSFIGIYLAILYGYVISVDEVRPLVIVLGVLAGISHSFQSAAADFQRSLYLFHVHESLNMEKETDDYFEKILKSDLSSFQRFLITLHRRYSRNQGLFLASGAALNQQLISLRKSGRLTTDDIRAVYADETVGLLKGWALLATNSHKIGIIASAFLPVWQGSFPGEMGLCWYFVYEVFFLNICMAVLVYLQRGADRRVLERLTGVSK